MKKKKISQRELQRRSNQCEAQYDKDHPEHLQRLEMNREEDRYYRTRNEKFDRGD